MKPYYSSTHVPHTSPINIATYVIDDDQDLLDIIKDAIDAAGITNYHLYTNEQHFLDGLTEEIHVCVVDHRLTIKTGLEILKEIKAKNENSYVIVYTGMSDPKIVIQYLNAGANKFVRKGEEKDIELLTKFLDEGLKTAQRSIEFADFIKSKRETLIK